MSHIVYEIKDVLDALDKMRADIYHDTKDVIGVELARLDVKLDALLSREADLAKTLAELVTDLSGKFSDITTDAAQVKAAVAAVIALLQGVVAQNAELKAKIDELLKLSPTPEQLAKLEEVAAGLAAQDADIDKSVSDLNDATSANTGS